MQLRIIDPLESRRLLASIAATTPYVGQQQVSLSSSFTVRFNETMNAATIDESSIRLFDPAGNIVPSSVSYNAATKTATLNPSQNLLTTNAYYALRVQGGISGVLDSVGGMLSGNYDVQFTTGKPSFSNTTLFNNLDNPTAVEFSPDGRVFVAEKRGIIKVFDDLTDTTPTIFADLRTKVHNYWDRGLLGIALDPAFTTGRPYIYITYTYDGDIGGNAPKWGTVNGNSDPGASDGSSTASGRLSKLTANGNVMSSEQVLIHDWQIQYPSHSIGDVNFGPDGYLYVSGGDGASFGLIDYGQINSFNDPINEGGALRSQDIRSPGDPVSLDGTVIRIDPDTGDAAPGNPFASNSDNNAKRIIAYGLRNPYRFTFRPGTSEIWIAETGWNDFEEINRIVSASDSNVENFGWPAYEGNLPQPGYQSLNIPLLASLYAQGPSAVNMPYYAYSHNEQIIPGSVEPTGGSSPTGIAFYNGGSFPDAYSGAMFFCDYSRKQIYVMYRGANGLPDVSTRQLFMTLPNSPVDLIQGPDGALYYTDFYNGQINRVTYNGVGTIVTNGKLVGSVIGTSGTSGNPAENAFDGDLSTYYNSTSPSGGWTGLALDSSRWIRQIKYAPRVGRTTAMVGGKFQGSNDPDFASGVVDLYTISSAPTAGVLTSVDVNPTGGGYQYVRYIGPTGSSSDVAEIEFHAGNGLSATYYNNDDFSGATVSRTDPTINFNWGTSAPVTGIGADTFSVRWSGKIQAIESGIYTFRTTSDDGVKLWVNGELLVDKLIDQSGVSWENTISLAAGQFYDIRVDYYENIQSASMQLEWKRPGGTFEPVPTNVLFTNGPSGNSAPTPVIDTPTGSLNWSVGDVINFSGSANDIEDGAMPATSLVWTVVLIHGNIINPSNTHEHIVQSFSGVDSGSFIAPDHEYPSWIELRLTATDSQNRTTTISRTINPLTVQTTLSSNIPGVQVGFESTSGTAPLSSTTIKGHITTISAPSQFVSGGLLYLFSSWSDGGSIMHDIITNSDTTITANYVLAPAPSAPSGLAATVVTSSRVDLVWLDNASNELAYRLERRLVGGLFTTVATLPSNTVTFTDTTVADGKTYEYRVLAVNGQGDSAPSNLATAVTPSILTPPAAPTSLASSNITTSGVTLSWLDNATNETGYRLERRLVGGAFAPIATLAAGMTSYDELRLNPGTAYEYRVIAFNASSDSAPSNVLPVTTYTIGTSPVAPNSLAGVVQSGYRVQLSWVDASNNETGFIIQRRYAGWIWGDVATTGANVTSYQDTTSIGNVTYEYRIVSTNAAGTSSPSDAILVNTANVAGSGPPATPTNVAAIATSSTQVNLAWTDVATDETGYKIERRIAGGTFAQIALTAANATSYADTTVAASTSYEYRIRATRSTTDGSYSTTATVTTPAPGGSVPSAPTNLTATMTTKPRVQLNWIDTSSNETAFTIQRRYTGWIWGDVGTVGANVTSFIDTTSIGNVMYEYRVVAQNGTGSSPFSNAVIVNTA